ncbi:MAG: 2-hydroxyacid dehydrogenase [Promethearchaeota archaeon]
MTSERTTVYLTSNVFLELGGNEKIRIKIREKIKQLWENLNSIANVKYFNGRFPSDHILKEELEYFKPHILGCHLSHPISIDMLKGSEIFAISTSTAGYNHIEKTDEDDILITHTPGVLHHTVADYTITLIMANLRNIIDLHNYVWKGKWTPEEKWDLDQSLSSVINNKVLGIIGLGEIGKEVLRRLNPWDLKILYFDLKRNEELEKKIAGLEYRDNIRDIFKEADIVSLHIPLNKHTERIINGDLLKLMKKGALLVNTSRGGIMDFEDLLTLLEAREIQIDFSFDVFPQEPIDEHTLNRLKKIKIERPEIRMILMPHNASADADTRGEMDIIFLENIINIIESSDIDDLKDVKIIPEHRAVLNEREWKIKKYWSNK